MNRLDQQDSPLHPLERDWRRARFRRSIQSTICTTLLIFAWLTLTGAFVLVWKAVLGELPSAGAILGVFAFIGGVLLAVYRALGGPVPLMRGKAPPLAAADEFFDRRH